VRGVGRLCAAGAGNPFQGFDVQRERRQQIAKIMRHMSAGFLIGLAGYECEVRHAFSPSAGRSP
jgi:hypothetical protein